MTDEQIMQGLKWCYQVEGSCGDCPYRPDDIKKAKCHDRLGNDVIDLIKRQQAEIDRLSVYNEEIVNRIRKSAIKEFANKLKDKKFYYNCFGGDGYALEVEDIDNLVKEMVGGTDV